MIVYNTFGYAVIHQLLGVDMKTKKQSGFTLIELLIVISIIGILAGMGIATYPVVMDKVYRLQCSSNLKSILDCFRSSHELRLT